MSTTNLYKKLLDIFHSRPEVYARAWYDNKGKRWAYQSVQDKVTPTLVKKHCLDTEFAGIGLYPLLNNNLCKWVSADFDVHDAKEKREVNEALIKMFQIAEDNDLHLYKEFSKSGEGIHIWAFFNEPVESWKARKMMMGIIQGAHASDLSSMDRLFPSQDVLHQGAGNKGIGNLIHMPFSAHFIEKGCYFVDEKGDKYTNTEDDIEAFIENVEFHTPEKLDIILKQWDLLNEKDQKLEIEFDNFDYIYDEDGLENVMIDPFMKWCQDNASKVDYNAWLGIISNLLPFGEAGVNAIHFISRLDKKRYDKDDTQKKIIECDGMKPITYNFLIKNSNFAEEERPQVSYKSPAGAGVKSRRINSPIKEKWGAYYLDKGKHGEKELSNFTLEPKSHVKVDGKIERVFDIKGQRHIVKDVQINGDVISSLEKFRKLTSEISTELQFYGNVNDLLQLQNYLTQQYPNIESINGERAIGLHKAKNEIDWTVITQATAWNKDGRVRNHLYYNDVEKAIAMSPEVLISKKELEEIRKYILSFNEFPICAGIMGWLTAIFVKQRLYVKHAMRFPATIIHGQAGSGKTETGRHIFQKWFSDLGTMYMVGDLTKFVFLKLNGSTNMFPLFLDEYKPSMIGDDKVKFISQMVRALYDQSTASRGKADQTIEEYKITSPVVIMGEQGFTEPALVERSIDIFMSKSESNEYLDHFLELKKLPIDRMGNAVLNWTLRLNDEDIYQMYLKEMEGKPIDRVSHNMSMVGMGLELLSKFFNNYNLKFDVTDAKEAFNKRHLELVKETGEVTTAVDNILRAMVTMRMNGVVDDYHVQMNDISETLSVNVRGVYPLFRKWAHDTKWEYEIITEAEFTRQVKKMKYLKGVKAVRMGNNGTPTKCRVFDLKALRKLDIVDENMDFPETEEIFTN